MVAVLAYLVAVLTMGVNNKEQCNEGGATGDASDKDRQGDGSKWFGVGVGVGSTRTGGGGGWRRQACQWARYTSLSHLKNCLRSDPELCRAMLSMLGTWWRS